MQTQNVNTMSAIDRALAAAKARKAAREANGEATPAETVSVTKAKAPKEPKVKAEKPTDEAAAAAKAQREADRAERAAAKAAKLATESAAKAEKRAERERVKAERKSAKEAEKASKKPAHMKKVERARSKCPALNTEAEMMFGDITANLSAQQIDALAQHLLVHHRAMQTIRALQSPQLPMGAMVRITGGEAKYVGMVGEVVHSQRLRAKVKVEGVKKPVYIYTGEADLTSTETATAAM